MTRGGVPGGGRLPARLASRFQAPCVFVVAPGGAGKTTLLHHIAASAEHALSLSLGVEDRDPSTLESMIDVARSQGPELLAIDDAHHVFGTPGELALRRLVAHADHGRRFVVASRVPPRSDLLGAPHSDIDVVTAPELALRIDEIAQSFHHVGGNLLDLECASLVASETAGWAGLVHRLAIDSRLVDEDDLSVAVAAELHGDFGSALLEDALGSLPSTTRQALERASVLATIEFAECAKLLGAESAAELLAATDSGSIMHVVSHGRRRLPPILRRHLRARAGEEAGNLVEPAHDGFAASDDGPTRPTPSPNVSRALACLLAGDVVGAVPLLQHVIRHGREPDRSLGRLVLLVVRESIAPRDATLDALAVLERDCVDLGLEGIARVVRGAVAAASGLPDRIARDVVEECDLRGDERAAAAASGIDFLVRFRHGGATTAQANELIRRLERLERADAATWVRASATLLTAASTSPPATATQAGPDAPLDGPRALLDAAQAVSDDPHRRDARLAAARRRALRSGLPRIPTEPLRQAIARATGSAPVAAAPRHPHLTVGCFGGFHLRADGADVDLRAVRPQARALLRMLALNSGAPLHRELIADVLWGDLGTESAVHALHVSVSSLRRALPTELTGPLGSLVERVGEAYRLGLVERRDCDLADFDDHLAEAAAAKVRRDAATTVDGLRRALDLYVGDVLPEDGPAEWVTGARERYRVRAAEAASSLAHFELRMGDPRAAVAAASRAVEIDPWLDESWRTLVTVHRTSGDVVAARRAAEGYRRMRVALGLE